jgi:hypothetical protein
MNSGAWWLESMLDLTIAERHGDGRHPRPWIALGVAEQVSALGGNHRTRLNEFQEALGP